MFNVHHWRKKWAKYTQYLSLYIFYSNCSESMISSIKIQVEKYGGYSDGKKNNYCYKKEGFLDDILVDTNLFLSLQKIIAQVALTSFFPSLGAAAGLWSIWPSLGGSQGLHFPHGAIAVAGCALDSCLRGQLAPGAGGAQLPKSYKQCPNGTS